MEQEPNPKCRHCGDHTEPEDDPAPGLCAMCKKAGRGSATGDCKELEMCPLCGHTHDSHIVVGTTPNAMGGGIVLCPVPRCECFRTWSTAGGEVARVPDADEIAQIRASFQRE